MTGYQLIAERALGRDEARHAVDMLRKTGKTTITHEGEHYTIVREKKYSSWIYWCIPQDSTEQFLARADTLGTRFSHMRAHRTLTIHGDFVLYSCRDTIRITWACLALFTELRTKFRSDTPCLVLKENVEGNVA